MMRTPATLPNQTLNPANTSLMKPMLTPTAMNNAAKPNTKNIEFKKTLACNNFDFFVSSTVVPARWLM